MGETVLIDELHLTILLPADLTEPEVEAVRRALTSDAFEDRLRFAVAAVVREFPALVPAAVIVSR